MNIEVLPNREEWLQARNAGVGSSDICSLLGIGLSAGAEPSKSPYALWAEKKGMIERDKPEGDWAGRLELGHDLEPIIHRRLEREVGADVKIVNPGDFTIATGEQPWHKVTVDRLCLPVMEIGDPLVTVEQEFAAAEGTAEFKTVEPFASSDWDEEPSTYATVQAQYQMAVSPKMRYAYVAAQIGFGKFRVFTVKRHQELIDALMETGARFWDHIESDTPPDVDGFRATQKALALVFPKPRVFKVDLDADFAAVVEARKELKAEIKRLEQQERQLANELKAAIGDAEHAEIAGYPKWLQWKEQRRKGHYVKASSSRVLRLVNPKTKKEKNA
jgi:predicted phage-related endonuclease